MNNPNILNKEFKYTHSCKTDIKATFERVRREMEEAAEKERGQSTVATEPEQEEQQ